MVGLSFGQSNVTILDVLRRFEPLCKVYKRVRIQPTRRASELRKATMTSVTTLYDELEALQLENEKLLADSNRMRELLEWAEDGVKTLPRHATIFEDQLVFRIRQAFEKAEIIKRHGANTN